jgi:hypothetical protein
MMDKCTWTAGLCLEDAVCRHLCLSHYNAAKRRGVLDHFPKVVAMDPEVRRVRNAQLAREHYRAGGAESRRKSREKVAVVRAERIVFISKYKTDRGCVDCGYKAHPAALGFDHIDPKTKRFGIAKGLTYSMKVLLAEIAKCEIRCANCHMIRSVKEGHLGRPRVDHLEIA